MIWNLIHEKFKGENCYYIAYFISSSVEEINEPNEPFIFITPHEYKLNRKMKNIRNGLIAFMDKYDFIYELANRDYYTNNVYKIFHIMITQKCDE